MSIFKPAPVPGSTGPSISNIAVTIHPNMPGLPSSQSNESVKASSSTGTRNLWVATDNSRYKEIHHQTLEPLSTSSQKSLHPLLKGPLSGAHSQTDPQTGDIFNYNLELGLHATYRIFKTSFSTGNGNPLYIERKSCLHPLLLPQCRLRYPRYLELGVQFQWDQYPKEPELT